MSNPHSSHYDFKFQRLMELSEAGEGDALFSELLRHGPSVFNPLSEFIIKQPNEPRLAVLIDLMGKCNDDRAISIMMRFLDIQIPELRCASANGLGWMRARVALEKLDQLEGSDPDLRVRHESRAAIEEILKDFPKLSNLLQHHTAFELHANISGEHDVVPSEAPDEGQQIKLMATLPRLLAVKYHSIPIHISPGAVLHLAVPAGAERRLEAKLAQLTGHEVHLHSWTFDRITKSIDRFYKLGDDDFCAFHDQLTELARDEVVECVLAGVKPDEPACPLSEANDAVEAAQMFLAGVGKLGLNGALVEYHPPEMTMTGWTTPDRKSSLSLEAPGESNRERFMAALRILANLRPGLSHDECGEIRCTICQPAFIAKVSGAKSLEGESLEFTFQPT